MTTDYEESHMNNGQIIELQDREIESVNGGVFWFYSAFVGIVGAGYTVGKDLALRDNARDALMCSAN